MTKRYLGPYSVAARKRDFQDRLHRPGRAFSYLWVAFLLIMLMGCAPIAERIISPSIPGGVPTPVLPARSTPPPATPLGSSITGIQLPISASDVEITQPGEERPVTPSPTSPSVSPTVTRKAVTQAVSDLLYISQDRLMRWDHSTGYHGLLADGVVEYAASADGRMILLLRSRRITANGIAAHDLDLLDLQSMQITPVRQGIARPFHMALSPDGQWLAYTREETRGPVVALGIKNPKMDIVLGDCTQLQPGHCGELAWSVDSRILLWSEAQGLWASRLEEKSAHLIHSTKVPINDPKGQAMDIDVQFTSLRWSPAGRFALVDIRPVQSHVIWKAILDTLTGRLAQVPDSFITSEGALTDAQVSGVLWLQDGSLISASSSDPSHQKPPAIRIWRIMPTNPNMLVGGRMIALYAEDFPFSSSSSKAIPIHCVNWLAQQDPQRIFLGVTLANSAAAPVLYSLSLENGRLQTLFPIPPDATGVLWAPDASGVLVIGSRGRTLFITATETLDLGDQLGIAPHAFSWLPPAPHR